MMLMNADVVNVYDNKVADGGNEDDDNDDVVDEDEDDAD